MNNENKQYTFSDDVGSVDNQGHIGSSGNQNTIGSAVGEVKGNQQNYQAARITITNYYYQEAAQLSSVESEETPDPSLPCPYRGLYHFGPNDADVFFGRDIFIEELYRATKTRNFIPVLGASGSGKSSVVLAGLVPKLEKEGHWKFTHFRPGSEPFQALASALVPLYTPNLDETDQIVQTRKLASYLRDTTIPLSDVIARIQQNHLNHRILLIADQFEELYTLCKQEEIRRRFIDCLLTCLGNPTTSSTSTLVLVITMRFDFLGSAFAYPDFADRLRESDIKIRSMNHQELVSVIENPVQRLGVTFETGLVERILEDVEDQPGNLPLLEFALTELWNKRPGQQLTHHVYEDIGQVKGALARHADEKYGNLTEAEKEKVRRIFIQLVRPGEGTEDTRRVAIKEELGEQNWSLVKQLADARLVVTSRNASHQETVEVIHEALIQNWGELQAWMNTDRVFRAWQERLRGAKKQWEATNKDSGSLLRGAALAEAEEKLNERPEDLIYEAEFIQQSLQEQKRLQRKKEEQEARELQLLQERVEIEKRAKHQLRRRFITAVVLAIVAGTASVGATYQWQVAIYREKKSRSIELATASSASLNVDTTRSLLLAIQANLIQNTPQAALALWNAFQKNHEEFQLVGHKKTINYAEFDPRDSQRVLTVSSDGTARIWNLDDLAKPLILKHGSAVSHGSFDPTNSNRILTVSYDGTAKIWNLNNSSDPVPLEGHSSPINYGSFNPHNSSQILTISSDGTARIWDIDEPKYPIAILQHEGDVWMGSFAPKNKNRVLTVSADSTAKVWDLNQPDKPLVTLEGHQGEVLYGEFDPKNSNRVLTSSTDRTARVWDLNNPTRPLILRGHEGTITLATFDPINSNRILTVSSDSTARVWNLDMPDNPIVLRGHIAEVTHATFNPKKSDQVLTVSADGTAKIWNFSNSTNPLYTLHGHKGQVILGTFDPQNPNRLLTISNDKTARVWDIEDKTYQELVNQQQKNILVSGVIQGGFDPRDTKKIFTISRDGTAKSWDIDSLINYQLLSIKNGSINKAFFAQYNQEILATISSKRMVSVWNLNESKKLLHRFKFQKEIDNLSFDNKKQERILMISDSTAIVKNLNKKALIELSAPSSPMSYGEFDPSHSNRVVTASADGIIRIWNLKKPTKPLLELRASQKAIWHISFNPKNSNQILTMGSDKVARVWDLAKGIKITELIGHQDTIVYGNFDPNNPNRVLTVSHDQTARVWDLRNPNNPLILEGDNSGIIYGNFDPNNSNRVITVSRDGVARVYIIGGQELLNLAWNHVSRCFIAQEAADYSLSASEFIQSLAKYIYQDSQLLAHQKYKPYCQF